MPYREIDDTPDFRAYTQKLNRGAEGGSAVAIVSVVLVLLGTVLEVRDKRPYFVAGILPFGLQIALICGVKLRRLRRLRFAVPTKVKDAQGGVLAVRGRVVASEQGLFVTPVSGQLAVWAHVDARTEGSSDSLWITVLDVTAARGFAIDDGSGELAYVDIGRAHMIRSSLPLSATAETTPRLRSFFRVNPPGPGAICSIHEQALRPDDDVIVVGTAHRLPGDDSTQPARLVLSGGETPLVVSRLPLPSQSSLIWGLVFSVLLMALGLSPFFLLIGLS